MTNITQINRHNDIAININDILVWLAWITSKPGGLSLPSLAVEVGLPEIPDFPLFSGVRANSIALNFARSGEAQATIGLIGQGETAQGATIDTAPEQADYTRFSQQRESWYFRKTNLNSQTW
jgi:hypothetical protein